MLLLIYSHSDQQILKDSNSNINTKKLSSELEKISLQEMICEEGKLPHEQNCRHNIIWCLGNSNKLRIYDGQAIETFEIYGQQLTLGIYKLYPKKIV